MFASVIALITLIGGTPTAYPQGQTLTEAPPAATPAAPATAAPSRTTAPKMSTAKVPLRQLIGPTEPVYLMNSTSTYTIFLPLSPRYDVKSCKLSLRFTNSIALLSERSTIRIVFNDRVIGQFYLKRDDPNRLEEIEIPVRFLELGSNRLQFVVAQHYTLECEDPAAPELWTQILPDESYIEASFAWNPIQPRLSMLGDLVDQKLWEKYQFHICMPGQGQYSDNQLSWGSTVTQGVALGLGFRPLEVTTGTSLLAGTDNIVIGPMSELTQFLTATEIGSINGPFIGIKPLPGDATRFLLVISGRNPEDVGQAAYAFSLINFPLPNSQFAQVDTMSLPDKPFWVRNAPLHDPGIYAFSQLGLEKDASIQGWNTGTVQLETYMPGDISNEDGSNIELRLHFSYGAAFRSDSVLNMFVNGQFQTAIRLDDARGASHYDHRIYLPVKAFQPGRNVVEISPKMVPSVTDHCEMVQTSNLWFTLYRGSEFVVPSLLRKARLPSLGLLSQTSFPFSAAPNGSDLAVFIGSNDITTISAAWTLLGKMAQISGSVFARAEISTALPRSEKNLILVGATPTLPDEALATSPVSPKELSRMRYVVSTSPQPAASAVGPVEEMLEKLRGERAERQAVEDPSTVGMDGRMGLTEDTVAVSYESPFHKGMAATLFTAPNAKILYEGISNLQDRLFWDNLAGDIAVWNDTPRSLATAQVGNFFTYGEESVVARTTTNVTGNPWLFTAIVIGSIAFLAFVLSRLLKKRDPVV